MYSMFFLGRNFVSSLLCTHGTFLLHLSKTVTFLQYLNPI